MSCLTNKAHVSIPNNASPITLPYGGAEWTWGAWTTLLAAGSVTDDLYLTDISSQYGPTAGLQLEVDLGYIDTSVSPAVNTSLGSVIRLSSPNPDNGSNFGYPITPGPLGFVPSGMAFIARQRGNNAASGGVPIAFAGFFGEPDVPWLNSNNYPLSCLPLGAAAIDITPNGVAWTPSSIYEFTSGLPYTISFLGLAMSNRVQDTRVEYDILIGDSGSEVVLTTLTASNALRVAGLSWYVDSPGIYVIPANTRISMLVRQSSTDTSNHHLVAMRVILGNPNLSPAVPNSGIYVLDVTKHHDTLYTSYEPVATEDVRYPTPFGKHFYAGSE